MGSWRSAVVSALMAVAVGVAPGVSAQPVPAAKVRATVVELADAVDRVLLDDRGAARGDYHWQRGVWEQYEVAWHTGQAIEALLAAHAVSGERRFLERARQAGEFWIGLRFATGPLKGMIMPHMATPSGRSSTSPLWAMELRACSASRV
jgi:hypothetical protein